METKYPTLRRPKRKLCYITDKEKLSNNWKDPLTLEDVDKIFDDIDVGTIDIYPTSVTLQSSSSSTNQSETSNSSLPQEKLPAENRPGLQVTSHCPFKPVKCAKMTNDLDDGVIQPATRSPYPKSHIGLDIPFKAHNPVKTSSPIEQLMNERNINKTVDGNSRAVSPLLFNCNDEAPEEPAKNPPSTRKPQSNRRVTENGHGNGEMEIPPSRVAQAKKSTHKKAVEVSCSQGGTKPSVLAVRRKPEGSAHKNVSESVPEQPPVKLSSLVGKDMTSFLQKIKQTVHSKPTQKSTVKASPLCPPPEPEDDFLILEDDAPLWFSIPSKSSTKRIQKLSKPSSSDQERLTERESKGSLTDTPQETPETANNKPESQAAIPKTNYEDRLPVSEDCPVDDPMEQQKSKKKKQPKKFSSKESDQIEDPVRTASVAAENPFQKTELKIQKSTWKNTFKDGNKIFPRRRSDALKEARKQLQGFTAVASAAADVYEEPNQEPEDTEDLGSFSDKEIAKFKVTGKAKQNKQSVNSEECSSQDDAILCKRRRKPTGQWWLTSQSEEEAESPLPPKKSKQSSNKEPSTTAPTVQAKKDKANKKIIQKQPALASSSHTNQPKESKRKQTKQRKKKGEKLKEMDEIIDTDEENEQQQFPDQDLNQEGSSPLIFTGRDVSINSGQIFHKVYGHSSSEKSFVMSIAAEDQLWKAEPAKRRRKPPNQCWDVNSAADVLGSTSRPQQLHRKDPKPKKAQEKQPNPGLGAPKNGNIAAESQPLGGAPVSPLKPLSTLKTVRCSLATFKNSDTSGVGTRSMVTNRDAHQSNKRNVTPRPAEKDTEFISAAPFSSGKDVLCGDDGESSGTPLNHKNPQDRKRRSEGTPNVFRSGPSSMIELEKYEDNDDVDLASSRVQVVLSASDLCSPPLKPLTLHSKDKSDLTEWFQSLWSSTADDVAVITPDQFQWYFYQDRALGIQVDLTRTSICSGKILMGSYMKKPLWVDHSATTVFNLLTSSVSVTVDGCVSYYSPGQAFIVECGRAYSIHNPNALPAVLYFTRISAESSD